MPASGPLYHYCIVRADLPRGIASAALVHAAGESSPGNLPSDTHAVILTVPNEEAIKSLAERLRIGGIPLNIIYEPDAPWNNQIMAIGCVPGRKETMRKFLSSLPLLR